MEVKILVGILVLVGLLQSGHRRHRHKIPPPTVGHSQIERFVRSKHPPLSEEEISTLVTSIQEASAKESLDAALLTALIYRESGFNPKAVSSSGAKGLGQLLDGTAREVGVKNPFDIKQNVFGTAKYIAKQIRRFEGKKDAVERGLACYRIGCRAIIKADAVPDIPIVTTFIQDIKKTRDAIHAL